MTFSEIPYHRVEYEKIEKRYLELIEECRKALSAEEIMNVLQKRYKLDDEMMDISLWYVRHEIRIFVGQRNSLAPKVLSATLIGLFCCSIA